MNGLRRLALAGAAAGLVALSAVPAAAAVAGVTVREVDTRQYPTVRLEVLVTGDAPRTTDFNLRENGRVVADLDVTPLKQTTKPVGTVLVVDTSGSMKSKGAIGAAQAAARSFISGMKPNDWVALVSFSSKASLRSGFTQDQAALTAAVDSLEAVGETALWDGVVAGAQLFDNRPDLQPNLVLLSDGADTVSSGTEAGAVSAIKADHAAFFAVAVASDDFDPAALGGFVSAAGGSLATSSDPGDLTEQFARIRAAIENQYEVVYTSKAGGGALSLDVSVAGASAAVQTRSGSVGAAPAPTVVANSGGGLLAGPTGKLVIFGLAAAAAGLFGFALFTIFGRRDDSLEGRLGAYTATEPNRFELYGDNEAGSGLAESTIVKRAVSLTSKVAERAGLLARVEATLEQANLPLRAGEAMFFYGAGVVVVGALVLLTAPTLPVALMFVGLLAAAPFLAVKFLRQRRLSAFEAQLPDTLNLLSGSLRAGYSFLQGLEAVAQETSEPMARELRRVLAEARLGRPLEEALEEVATRMESEDFSWSVMAIRIQREVGGNLAELLSTVADTMIQRSRMRGEIKALTAEGRISGIIMGCLPVALGGFMFMSSPDYISVLFEDFKGWAMVGGSAVMAVAGYAWIQKIIKIEV